MKSPQQHDMLLSILESAFLRSLSMLPAMACFKGGVVVMCGAKSDWDNAQQPKGKFVVFGSPTPHMLQALGLRKDATLPSLTGHDSCLLAAGNTPHTKSAAFLTYISHPLHEGLASHLHRRPFCRFDYADEWNNLGFGRIRTDDSIWAALGEYVPNGATELAAIRIKTVAEAEEYSGAYLTLYDTPTSSILWCARPVGPVDSTEWNIVERFISDWRADALPCLPCLRQTPAGCRCLVTMRLDCDEDIASARSLFELYATANIPFSLAVKTSLPMRPEDIALLNDVRAHGGSLLSHTHTHQVNWGASYEDVLQEAQTSRQWFTQTWSAPPPDIAVSPFHTNPPYAVQALAQAGFTGFVSGIIHNDPEYLLGRAGIAPFTDDAIVSISQQAMLHGDCYRRQNFGIDAFIQAFAAQYASNGIFGYLDHPFSDRYQYDWANEAQRLEAHSKLISAIRSHSGVWFWNQQQCFDFVRELSQVHLQVTQDEKVRVERQGNSGHYFVYRYRGEEYQLTQP